MPSGRSGRPSALTSDVHLDPGEYHLDETWRRLHAELTAARLKQAVAEDAVRDLNYGDGRKAALEAAELAVEEAEQALADREATIAHKEWGTW